MLSNSEKKKCHYLVYKIDAYLGILPKIIKSFQIVQNQLVHGTDLVSNTYFQIGVVWFAEIFMFPAGEM